MGRTVTRKTTPLHIMLLPGVVLAFLFNYVPMFGIAIAFTNYDPFTPLRQVEWVGLDSFRYIMSRPSFVGIVRNTLIISTGKVVVGLSVALILSLLLSEIRSTRFKQAFQTVVFIPHFMSWVIIGGVLISLLSMRGMVNSLLVSGLGIEPIYFLGDNAWFRKVIIATDTWKEMGFSIVVFSAAIVSIDPNLYEAAYVDGGNRVVQLRHITLPGMAPTIILLATLSLGRILNAGFEQIFTLYSPQVYETADILDTFVYRLGLVQSQYGPAAAVGLFKSALSFFLLALSYRLAMRFANYRIF